MKTKELTDMLDFLGFESIDEFKKYMLSKVKLNEYGAVCYTEARKGFELNYSDNCLHKFGIGGNVNGSFVDHRFN